MVNFGKRLENGLKVPRWQSKYVNYKILKKYISEILGFEVSGDVSAAEARVDTFIKVLSEDIEVVEARYLNTIEELKESLAHQPVELLPQSLRKRRQRKSEHVQAQRKSRAYAGATKE